eukprot:CAMPEP_0172673192 /NCGR_PEP_ID=MMETSP1074-20121228/12000_1 /TAXON_ID=2916 /ORGANISM="Ceratium fusus, Strain PA161109" /LENGTH=60 /DNA_ID=CAMNT_0013490461 /DNA_START=83 /DNA_END=265 /DNA_ORIENTATION=-
MESLKEAAGNNVSASVIFLVVLGFGIRWVYQRLQTGTYDYKKGDIEMEGTMRTRIDHGDL